LLVASHHAFTFYFENPISSVPLFLIQNISVSFVRFVVKIEIVSATSLRQRT